MAGKHQHTDGDHTHPELEARIVALEGHVHDYAAPGHTHAAPTEPDPVPPPVDPPDPPPTGPLPVGGDPARRGPKPVVYRTPSATVSGTSLAAVNAARDKAGTNGVVFVPAGVYPAPSPTVVGQTWQLDPNAIFSTMIRPIARGVTFEGGEMRGGAWLGIGTDAHQTTFRAMRIRGRGITNESRDGLAVLANDMREIPGEFVELFYDSDAHRDVQGLRIEDNYCVRTSYSVNAVAMFSGADGGGRRKLFDAILRNNWTDNGWDKGQGPGGLGAFATYEMWGCVRAIAEYNDARGGGFIFSNVRDQDGEVRFNKGLIGVKKAWAFWESGGTGTAGTKIHDNLVEGEAARNGVLIATATPNPVRPVLVTNNRHPGVRLTSDTSAPGYQFSGNVGGTTTTLAARFVILAGRVTSRGYPASRKAPGEAA